MLGSDPSPHLLHRRLLPRLRTKVTSTGCVRAAGRKVYSSLSFLTFFSPMPPQSPPTSPSSSPSPPPSDEWLSALDPEGRRYYFNELTGENVWSLPEGVERYVDEEEKVRVVWGGGGGGEDGIEKEGVEGADEEGGGEVVGEGELAQTVPETVAEKAVSTSSSLSSSPPTSSLNFLPPPPRSVLASLLAELSEADAALEPGTGRVARKIREIVEGDEELREEYSEFSSSSCSSISTSTSSTSPTSERASIPSLASTLTSPLTASYTSLPNQFGLLSTWLLDIKHATSTDSHPFSPSSHLADLAGLVAETAGSVIEGSYDEASASRILTERSAREVKFLDNLVADPSSRLLLSSLYSTRQSSPFLTLCLKKMSKRGHHGDVAVHAGTVPEVFDSLFDDLLKDLADADKTDDTSLAPRSRAAVAARPLPENHLRNATPPNSAPPSTLSGSERPPTSSFLPLLTSLDATLSRLTEACTSTPPSFHCSTARLSLLLVHLRSLPTSPELKACEGRVARLLEMVIAGGVERAVEAARDLPSAGRKRAGDFAVFLAVGGEGRKEAERERAEAETVRRCSEGTVDDPARIDALAASSNISSQPPAKGAFRRALLSSLISPSRRLADSVAVDACCSLLGCSPSSKSNLLTACSATLTLTSLFTFTPSLPPLPSLPTTLSQSLTISSLSSPLSAQAALLWAEETVRKEGFAAKGGYAEVAGGVVRLGRAVAGKYR